MGNTCKGEVGRIRHEEARAKREEKQQRLLAHQQAQSARGNDRMDADEGSSDSGSDSEDALPYHGALPKGIVMDKRHVKFVAQCHHGKQKCHLGTFATQSEAVEAHARHVAACALCGGVPTRPQPQLPKQRGAAPKRSGRSWPAATVGQKRARDATTTAMPALHSSKRARGTCAAPAAGDLTVPDRSEFVSDGHPWLRRRVLRTFGCGAAGGAAAPQQVTTSGRIVAWLPAAGENDQALWHCLHDDGDSEDLEEGEARTSLAAEAQRAQAAAAAAAAAALAAEEAADCSKMTEREQLKWLVLLEERKCAAAAAAARAAVAVRWDSGEGIGGDAQGGGGEGGRAGGGQSRGPGGASPPPFSARQHPTRKRRQPAVCTTKSLLEVGLLTAAPAALRVVEESGKEHTAGLGAGGAITFRNRVYASLSAFAVVALKKKCNGWAEVRDASSGRSCAELREMYIGGAHIPGTIRERACARVEQLMRADRATRSVAAGTRRRAEDTWTCKVCRQDFGTQQGIRNHTKSLCGEHCWPCYWCGGAERAARGSKAGSAALKDALCKPCQYRHCKGHKGPTEGDFACEFCHRSFDRRQGLRVHQISCAGKPRSSRSNPIKRGGVKQEMPQHRPSAQTEAPAANDESKECTSASLPPKASPRCRPDIFFYPRCVAPSRPCVLRNGIGQLDCALLRPRIMLELHEGLGIHVRCRPRHAPLLLECELPDLP